MGSLLRGVKKEGVHIPEENASDVEFVIDAYIAHASSELPSWIVSHQKEQGK